MSNFTFFILFFLILLSLFFLQFFIFRRSFQKISESKQNDTSLLLIQEQIGTLRDHLRQNLEGSSQVFTQQITQLNQQLYERFRDQGQVLSQTHETMGKRLDNAARVVGELQSRLGKLEESNLKIFEVGKDIASLQQILKSPKMRGGLGELFLGDLLSQILPAENYILQYTFKSGDRVDAVIKLGGHLVSIDSKFPLENFKRYVDSQTENEKKGFRKLFLNDVKKHIDAIASKYIHPDEDTFDFALMYIPAENVYYEIIIKEEQLDGEFSPIAYAMKKRVIPVSPNNLYVYLNTILLGLKGLKIEESAREILINLSKVQNDLVRFNDDFSKIGTHLGFARSAYETADKRLNRLTEKVERFASPVEEPALKQIVGE